MTVDPTLTQKLSPLSRDQQIDAALQMNLTTLKEAFFDWLAALVLALVAVVSLCHATLRIGFAILGLLLWSLALFVVFLYWVRSLCVAQSSSSLHRQFDHDEIGKEHEHGC
jgi:hypothetical protein